mmetsp:Transcript_133244/g.284878  ORF Transcript_133244/g.284878 Transcript_133244/m.284878 type:complete len:212 (+) Transcript_133244:526-1161(+)
MDFPLRRLGLARHVPLCVQVAPHPQDSQRLLLWVGRAFQMALPAPLQLRIFGRQGLNHFARLSQRRNPSARSITVAAVSCLRTANHHWVGTDGRAISSRVRQHLLASLFQCSTRSIRSIHGLNSLKNFCNLWHLLNPRSIRRCRLRLHFLLPRRHHRLRLLQLCNTLLRLTGWVRRILHRRLCLLAGELCRIFRQLHCFLACIRCGAVDIR